MTLFTTVRGLQFWLTEKDFKEGKVAHYIRQNYHLLIAFPAAGLLQRLHIRHLQHVLQQLHRGQVLPHSLSSHLQVGTVIKFIIFMIFPTIHTFFRNCSTFLPSHKSIKYQKYSFCSLLWELSKYIARVT